MTTNGEPLVPTWRRALLNDASVAPTNKLVALVLQDFWGADGSCAPWGGRPERGAGPTMESLSTLSGKSARTVIRAMKELERAGYVSVTYRSPGRGSNRYIATLPKKAAPRKHAKGGARRHEDLAPDLLELG